MRSHEEKELDYARNYAIKCIDRDMESFSFNTAIARLMEYVTAIYNYDRKDYETKNVTLLKDCVKDLILLIAPFAPHFAEELWQITGNKKSVFSADYPVADENALVLDEIELAVQINSKVKAKIIVAKDATNDEIEKIALACPEIVAALGDKTVKKVIVVKNRLVNVIA